LKKVWIVLVAGILLVCISFYTNFFCNHIGPYDIEPTNSLSEKKVIYVDLVEQSLELIDVNSNQVIKKYKVAGGKYQSPSPIGTFKITFKEKWGEGFGTHFMGINVPWGKYGIHGTDKPNSIGWASSHGCIRMNNKDIGELYQLVAIGTKVIIDGGPFGPFGSGLRTLKPGDRGSDVFEVQRIMQEQGFYPLRVDGIYGEGMKAWVLKFRKSHQMYASHNIDMEFYKILGIELFE